MKFESKHKCFREMLCKMGNTVNALSLKTHFQRIRVRGCEENKTAYAKHSLKFAQSPINIRWIQMLNKFASQHSVH